MVIGASQFAFRDLRSHLLDCGYDALQLVTDIEITQGRSVPLAAFAQSPHDSRSACIAAIDGFPDSETAVTACRGLGAPLVLTYSPDQWEVWKQGPMRPQFLRRILPSELTTFFKDQGKDLTPQAIYRAKTWARFDTNYQLDFVDVGLMPLVEEEAGRKLAGLIERVVLDTKLRLKWKSVSQERAHWLLKSNFWLLAAKILQDKGVPSFAELELIRINDVFTCVAKHYGAAHAVNVESRQQVDALREAARAISSYSNLGLISTDALAYLYENAVISKEVRNALGTHSTPTYLVDYILGKLRPWIEEIPVNERQVFEPGCGHAVFLLAAMQLLGDLVATTTKSPEERHEYLRTRLHGCDIDSFALEIARLGLTLADVPNPNGWDLQVADMFQGELLERHAHAANIVLSNPPFANFSVDERRSTTSRSTVAGAPQVNKAAEMLWRVAANMQPGAIFGIVVPYSLLRSQNAKLLRKLLVANFEFREVCILPDNVFIFSDAESAVILARRLPDGVRKRYSVLYRHVRESGIENFKRRYEATYESKVPSEQLTEKTQWSLFVPDLMEIWDSCRDLPTFRTIAEIGQGFQFRSRSDHLFPKQSVTESAEPARDLVKGFVRLRETLETHEQPDTSWLNLEAAVIRRPGLGTTIGIPQVLLNYAPVSRGPWRLKAFLDRDGHPVTSRFLVIRPADERWPLEAVWGICNSPFANAYSYAFSTKRDVLAGLMRKMPIPDINRIDLRPLVFAARKYLEAANTLEKPVVTTNTTEQLKELHWRIDAEVLRLYALPAYLERQLLDLFSGVERRGVPFGQPEYFPTGFNEVSTLRDFVKITFDWETTNERRAELIDKKKRSDILKDEKTELDDLQRLTDARIRMSAPLPIKQLEAVKDDLKRRGMWEGD